MSKYIPGNQKHLTLEDRIHIENSLNKGSTFRDIAKYLCKDPTTISKEVKAHHLSDWYHKGTFYNARNFCIHRYHCRKANACGKIILCGIKCTSCPTCSQHALILKRNVVTDWIKPLMSAMAVVRRLLTVRLHTNTPITPALQTENIGKNSAIPVPGST